MHPAAATMAFTLFFGGFAMPSKAQSFDALQATFMEKYDALNSKRDESLKKLSEGYLQVLERLMKQATDAGRLESALPIRDEIAAVNDGKWPLDDLADDTLGALKANRTKFVTAREKIVSEHAAGLVQLASRMEAQLKRKEVELTRQEKLDEAVSVRRMREALMEDAGLQRAKEQVSRSGGVAAGREIQQLPPEVADEVLTVRGVRYYRFPEPMSRADAAAACEKLGGKLVSIDSKEEYEVIHRIAVEKQLPLWIDLQDEAKDGDWRHADGSKARFLKWQSGEPNGGDAQQHVMIGFRGDWDMRDVSGDDKFHVICEW